jgi:citrate lyase beta subunit
MNLLRSLLFVPGSRPDRFDKALAAGADLICIDLEDAVLPANKTQARQDVVDYISNGNVGICVRINPLSTDLGQEDLKALAMVEPDFIMLAKCSGKHEIEQSEHILHGTDIKLIGLIETVEGLENAKQIAKCHRISSLMFGGADMSAELRCDFSFEPLLFVRSQLVMAAASADIGLIDVPYIDLKNPDGLSTEVHKVKALGFTAKAAIHPNQVTLIHQAFMPTEQQISYAQAVLDAVDSPDAGVVVVNGRMIDRPIILASQRIISLVNAANKSS